MKSDVELQRDVMDELEWEPSVTHAGIGVSVSNGVVTLSGHLPSYAQKLAAEKAAGRVTGVKAVVEKIEVKLPSYSLRDDEAIARTAVSSLTWHPMVPDGIHVSVENGRVTLRGTVEWAYQREAAARAVSEVEGVILICNEITIEEKIVPNDIKDRIEKALKRAAEREAKRIHVNVVDHKVVLSGTVRSLAELNTVRGVAWGAPGVTSVDANLTVTY